MRTLSTVLILSALFAAPAIAQKRVAPKKDLTFPEAVEVAKAAFDAESYGETVTALQAAIKAVQQLQRAAILAALPQPEGFKFEDEEPAETAGNPFAAGIAALGQTISRRYRNGDKSINVEVMANSPIVQMMSMMFANPALITNDGGELVEYGKHKAILKDTGGGGVELTILLNDKHIVKATSQGLTDDELLAIFDQAAVDKIEKPLGQ